MVAKPRVISCAIGPVLLPPRLLVSRNLNIEKMLATKSLPLDGFQFNPGSLPSGVFCFVAAREVPK